MDPAPNTPQPPPADWTATGFRTAAVSGLFTLAVMVLMVVNHVQTVNPVDHPKMIQYKAAIAQAPGDENLKTQLRDFDLQLRRDYNRRVTLGHYGAWLLLAGAAVFLASIKPAAHRKKLPKPQKLNAAEYARQNLHTTCAVAAFGVVTAGGLLAISNHSATAIVLAENKTAAAIAAAPVKAVFPTVDELKTNWPRFRGPFGAGLANGTNYPVSWDVTNGNNVLWKVPVPISSPSSPVVWGERIFLAGADATNRQVYCFDTSGKLLWTGKVDPKRSGSEPPKVMEDGGFGPCTPCTDGQRVYAIFANGDVGAFDLSGGAVWSTNMGPLDNMYGHAASLEMYQDRLIVQLDQGEAEANKSKIYALDAATGRVVWQTAPRPVPSSWATPIVINDGNRALLVAAGAPWVMGYDPSNGQEIWRAKAMSGEVVPSPVYVDGVVYTAVENEKLRAIKADGRGDVTATNILWGAEEGMPDIISPLCDGPRAYVMTSGGVLTCYDSKTGKKLWNKDLDANIKSSFSVAGDKIYAFTENGTALVYKTGEQCEEVSRQGMGEGVFASPAFANGRIYIRGLKSLFCIGVKAP